MANHSKYRSGYLGSPYREWDSNNRRHEREYGQNEDRYDNYRSSFGDRFEYGDRYDMETNYHRGPNSSNFERPYTDYSGYDQDYIDNYHRAHSHYAYDRMGRPEIYGRPGYGTTYRRGGTGYEARDHYPGRDAHYHERYADYRNPWYDEEWERKRELQSGAHRGKGPKGYKRTDERIQEDLHDRLSEDPFLDPSEIEVSVVDGEVMLVGMVDSRMDKHRAEDIADRVLGVREIQNRIRVNSSLNSQGSKGTKAFTGKSDVSSEKNGSKQMI